jgi:2,3-bisphosphoglycerate-independent phosphoglycerate mutase
MKSIIIVGDGMSDRPVKRLGLKTPLMVAQKSSIDRIAREGQVGLFKSIPTGMPAESDVANISILGYDPARSVKGRAVLEAASLGVDLDPSDVAFRCNLITLEDGKIKNHSAGHISTEESSKLICSLDEALGAGRGEMPVTFHQGVSYRNLLVLRNGWASPEVECTPPHDHVGERVLDLLPRALNDMAEKTRLRLVELYERSLELLADHPVNKERRASGKDVADAIWPWSPGRRPSLRTFQELYGIQGAAISAVDLVRGLGRYAGMEIIEVPGATGLWNTNYEGKAQACLDALKAHDLVYVHVEATDEASHSRDLDLKIRCIEQLDRRLVHPILAGLENSGIEATVAVLSDHPTLVETGNHAGDPVPVAIWRHGSKPDAVQRFDEAEAVHGSLNMMQGDEFIRQVLGIRGQNIALSK